MDELESSSRTLCQEIAGHEEQCCAAFLLGCGRGIECVVHLCSGCVFLGSELLVVAFLAITRI